MILALFVLGFGGAAAHAYLSSGRVYHVVLTAKGFEPATLTVEEGDTVVFSGEVQEPFWPASNPHPLHGIYPAFDPEHPISEGKSWSFRFSKEGTWRYHDHLDPTREGVIVVTAPHPTARPSCNSQGRSLSEKEQCWDESITSVLQNRGIKAAFDQLDTFYKEDPSFFSVCHSYTHTIGREAYLIYAKKGAVELSPLVSICNYGFFHGFLEALLAQTGDIGQARDFCTYAGKALAGERSGAANACYHGWGHGLTDGSDKSLWGNAQGMADASLSVCEKLAADDFQLSRCASGVFNSLDILSQEATYRIEDVQRHPFEFCNEQKPLYREPCYTNMTPVVLRLAGGDFLKGASYITEHLAYPDQPTTIGGNTEEVVVSSFFSEFMRLHLHDADYVAQSLSLCRTFPSLRLYCIEGIALGHMFFGEPGKEYEKAFAFCQNDLLHADEQDICFKSILPKLPLWYAPSQVKTLCQSVKEEYASAYCHFSETP